jgi:hypothetical protein
VYLMGPPPGSSRAWSWVRRRITMTRSAAPAWAVAAAIEPVTLLAAR